MPDRKNGRCFTVRLIWKTSVSRESSFMEQAAENAAAAIMPMIAFRGAVFSSFSQNSGAIRSMRKIA